MKLVFENKKEIIFTYHAKQKLKYYGFSEKKIKKILKNPDRVEEGIVPETIALMKKAGSKKHPYEIWVMYQKIKNQKIKIISCWKYPGESPIQKEISIPEEIKKEIEKIKDKISIGRGAGN